MNKLFLFPLLILLTGAVQLPGQADIYFQPINQVQINLRGGVQVLGSITKEFPSAGFVVVHFDGECYASVGDRIVLAGTDDGDWGVDDGSIAVESSLPGFGRPFSHTRVYPVSAGTHTYSAVGENYVETDGSGRATIYGSLTVKYFPDTELAGVEASGIVFGGDVTNSTVVAEHTIHINQPGRIIVRFDGYCNSDPGDRIVLAASNTMNWSFNDGNVSVEAVNEGDVVQNSFSHTRVYNVNAPGDYTYYAIAQTYGKKAGNGMIAVYGNLLVEYYPTAAPAKVLFDGFTLPEIDLNGQSTELTSLTLDAPAAGKVMVVLDGYLTAGDGYDIILAASNNGEWSANDGRLDLQALDNDQNRYSFSHTRVYSIPAGTHTFYGVGEIMGGSGDETADLFGALTVTYFPTGSTSTFDAKAGVNTFTIYPNPSGDIVYVQLRDPDQDRQGIQILDVNGKILSTYPSASGGTTKLELSGIPPSMYWVKVGDGLKPLLRM